MDEVRVFVSRVSASPAVASASEAFLGGRGGPEGCDGALARATGTAVAT